MGLGDGLEFFGNRKISALIGKVVLSAFSLHTVLIGLPTPSFPNSL